MKSPISKKGKINRLIVSLLSILLLLFICKIFLLKEEPRDASKSDETGVTKKSTIKNTRISKKDHITLDVPLINQMDDPELYNGCEVTSLAMLLNYYGFDVTKNELAESLTSVPYQYDDGLYGNPNKGFVGSMDATNGIGYSVYHAPIASLAQKYIDNDFQVIDLTGKSLDEILAYCLNGAPIWTIVTTSYAATDDLETWKTPTGTVEISWSVHSAVITGFNSDKIIVNDPYGEKNKTVDREDFEAAFKQMGNQAITITKK